MVAASHSVHSNTTTVWVWWCAHSHFPCEETKFTEVQWQAQDLLLASSLVPKILRHLVTKPLLFWGKLFIEIKIPKNKCPAWRISTKWTHPAQETDHNLHPLMLPTSHCIPSPEGQPTSVTPIRVGRFCLFLKFVKIESHVVMECWAPSVPHCVLELRPCACV